MKYLGVFADLFGKTQFPVYLFIEAILNNDIFKHICITIPSLILSVCVSFTYLSFTIKKHIILVHGLIYLIYSEKGSVNISHFPPF